MSKNRPIAFFDSGVGLFSILKETKKILPHENFIIFADQKHHPFGEKKQSEITKFVEKAADFLIKKHKIKLMVIACNTASVSSLAQLREKFKIPFVGVVPAVKPAIEQSKSGKIAIMSTPATAKSPYLLSLINQYGDQSKTLRLSCRGLSEAIEFLDKKRINKLTKEFTSQIKKFDPDFVVLGCTHYPLIKNQIKKYLGPKIQIVDSSKSVARQIKKILEQNNESSSEKSKDIYYTTGSVKNFSDVVYKLLKYKIDPKNQTL